MTAGEEAVVRHVTQQQEALRSKQAVCGQRPPEHSSNLTHTHTWNGDNEGYVIQKTS